jgi:sugar phosphate isomerase/epimerase
MAQAASAAGVTLVLENEKETYADTVLRCVDLLGTVDDRHLGAAFDAANFVQCGERPYPDAYRALRRWLAYVHVKDVTDGGEIVPAGEGTADWPAIIAALARDGYDGFLSLEPHLASGHRFGGFSGVEGFRRAARALRRLMPP